MVSTRMRRVNELMRRELAELCERLLPAELAVHLTVTEVRTSPDLRQAKAFVSVYGPDDRRTAVLKELHECRTAFQRAIGRHTGLKYTPVLSFELDETLARADRVLGIIDSLDLKNGPSEPSAGSAAAACRSDEVEQAGRQAEGQGDHDAAQPHLP